MKPDPPVPSPETWPTAAEGQAVWWLVTITLLVSFLATSVLLLLLFSRLRARRCSYRRLSEELPGTEMVCMSSLMSTGEDRPGAPDVSIPGLGACPWDRVSLETSSTEMEEGV